MKKYLVTVPFKGCLDYEVEAASKKDAIQKVRDFAGPLDNQGIHETIEHRFGGATAKQIS